ncbi:hypothetical protein [Ktedonobacter robiniae]|uniref:Photosynthesis system II assembly factor Ycf48/Hcf136-like domain-containing protein n=1 Tax=Ktedonobacter robiniae TaxID=2778365 RepID=A0ABQ3UL31_9CHLR|nr:hypothetical protein [Ktedonobacter robiniae]GHO53449.1 hypothetical protein KSB_19240 [Ktedonobacter robiniae]
MSTVMSPHRHKSWSLYLRKGALVLCFSLLLIGITVSSAFANTHAQSAAAATSTTSQDTLQNVIQLGGAGPGGVAMIDKKVGWTLTSALRRTSDGGKTWQTVAQPADQEMLGQAYVLNGQVAWYLTYDSQTYAITALYRTNDGGQTWKRFAWIDANQYLQTLSVADNQSAWISTSDSNSVSHLFLVGGTSQDWQEATLPAQNGSYYNYFTSQTTGYTTFVNSNDNGNNSYTLYRTSDSGQNWAQLNLPLPANVPATAAPTNIRFLGFGNQQEGYLIAAFGDTNSYTIYNSYIYRTQDGGQTWQIDGGAVPANTRVIQIDNWHVVNAAFAFVAIGGKVGFASLQAGSWDVENVTLPSNLAAAPFLSVLSSNHLFVSAGTSDYTAQNLYDSQNDGQNWHQIASIPN